MWQRAAAIGFYLLLLPLTSHAQAKLAIIIDDIGYNQELSLRAARLPGRFTLAILPYTPYAQVSAQVALSQQKELMLHLPMSNEHHYPLGKGGLTEQLSKDEFTRIIRDDIAQIPQIRGVNNHMGSRLTQNAQAMDWVMNELVKHSIYFVDSRTTAQTVAYQAAANAGIPHLKRDVFLDDDDSILAISNALNNAMRTAKKSGFAVAIGHPYPNTLTVLEQLQPKLASAGIELVYPSQLAKGSTHAAPLHTIASHTTAPDTPITTGLPTDYCPTETGLSLNVLSPFIDSDAKNVNMVTLPEH